MSPGVAALPRSVARTRLAVRRALAGLHDERPSDGGPPTVLVACSGGPDSMALAAATAFVASRAGVPAGLLTVDHRLQDGSAERAADVAAWGAGAGLRPSRVLAVEVAGTGGPEAAARDARYAALAGAARAAGATAVLLGHTREDQAETVLLALARGGGPRGLAGMPYRRKIHGVVFLRPFLDLGRAEAREACTAQRLPVWEDPHNSDPAYARSRVRAALPVLARELGPDVVDNLARTARLLADDVAALDHLAAEARNRVATGPDGALDVAGLCGLPAALRTRVLRAFALDRGAPGGALAYRHIQALDALVTDWHGQGPVDLPGGHRVRRDRGMLLAEPRDASRPTPPEAVGWPDRRPPGDRTPA